MPTEPVPDYTPYLKHARQRMEDRRKQATARLKRAWSVARQAAALLRQEYRPTRIIAFGSLVHPEIFGLHSDIDLAVEGVDWPDYLHAWDAVEELTSEFKIDLIDMGIISERMRQRVDEDGQVL